LYAIFIAAAQNTRALQYGGVDAATPLSPADMFRLPRFRYTVRYIHQRASVPRVLIRHLVVLIRHLRLD